MASHIVINDKSNHLGHFYLDIMKRKSPEGTFQIDAATGEKESNASVLSRSIRLARCLRDQGLQPGDVLALGGRNHVHVHIPYYAALLNGLPIVGVDPYFKYKEIKHLFKYTKPTIAFCQKETKKHYERAAEELGIDVKIVTFDGEDEDYTLSKLMDTCQDDNTDDFEPTQIDPDKIYAWLVTTSGTTGLPKVAAFKHKPLITQMLMFMKTVDGKRKERKVGFNTAPVQWISGYFNAIAMPFLDQCKLQTSRPDDIGHVIDIINQYKPVTMMSSPSTLSLILQHEKTCDLECFDILTLTGAKVYKDLKVELKKLLRTDAILMEAYAQTETIGPILMPNPFGPLGSCGLPLPAAIRQIKLVDPLKDNIEITEPFVTGELWTKGLSFTEYYYNPEETEQAFTDGWYRTGDLLYRDEGNNYFYVDRLKMLIKYRNHHINPNELEEVIMHVPGVREVCVVGVAHPVDGERAVAAVVRRPGAEVSVDVIQDTVANNLAPSKHLRGGVVFLDALPKTSTGKVARAQLKDLVLNEMIDFNP